MNSIVTVDVKSAWYSKVNWIAALTGVGVIGTELLPIVPPKYQHYITAAIGLSGAIATVITKTFYTTSVTPSSANKV